MPPSSTDSNIFELSGVEREERDIHSLPSNLMDAVRAMRRDELVRETLGEHIFGKYVEHKTEEWDEYKIRVTPWELDRYLERYLPREGNAWGVLRQKQESGWRPVSAVPAFFCCAARLYFCWAADRCRPVRPRLPLWR